MFQYQQESKISMLLLKKPLLLYIIFSENFLLGNSYAERSASSHSISVLNANVHGVNC